MTWQPVPGQLMTRWAKDVSPENAWQEYPRPQMTRPDWCNLNGLWDYLVVPRQADNEDFDGSWESLGKDSLQGGEILVPYPIESALSGVKRGLQADEVLWYRRSFKLPGEWQGRRILLHFGAVDWEARVFLNGTQVGEHTGGYLPFWLDVTSAVEERGERAGGARLGSDRQLLAATRQTNAQAANHLVHGCLRHLADGLDGSGAANLHRKPEDHAGCGCGMLAGQGEPGWTRNGERRSVCPRPRSRRTGGGGEGR